MVTTTDSAQVRRIELILRQVDSLPTLPAVATRLLTLTASDDSHIQEVIELVSSDQALTAKILSLCSRAFRGVRREALTIDKAVVLLGFNAIRSAVLSLKVFEVFDAPRPAAWSGQDPSSSDADATQSFGDDAQCSFDRANFWRHCLAVGIAAELIAAAHPGQDDITAPEAFVCGLLHDLGKLALDYMLPKSFARVISLTELNQGNIAELERRVIGIDHHTTGKRLAEQWQLPEVIRDCIWLHGSTYEMIPNMKHRRMIGLISLADLLVRRHHIGYSGNFLIKVDQDQLATALDLDPRRVDDVTHQLHEELLRRQSVLGLDDQPSRELFLQSIQQANEVLGRLNDALERRSRTAAGQSRILEAITHYHNQTTPGQSVQDALDRMIASATEALGVGYYGALYQAMDTTGRQEGPWLLCQYDRFEDQPTPTDSRYVDPPTQSASLSEMQLSTSTSLSLMSALPWISSNLRSGLDLWSIKLLPVSCGLGTIAILLHNQPTLPPWRQMHPLTSCWGAAIAWASQHDNTRRLGEELAQANLALSEAQEHLVRTASMVRLGEMAAGAAHEMNNPLAVISGRSQLLTMSLSPGSNEQQAAQTIFEQSHRLSDLITLLRLFADPPKLTRRYLNIGMLLDDTIKRVRRDLPQIDSQKPITLHLKNTLADVELDPTQMGLAIRELLLNAVQSHPKTSVHVTARPDPSGQAVIIQVKDDGKGMDSHTLDHATDPFFSSKGAGRQVGMGLARAEQLIHAHGGSLELHSTPGVGTVVTVKIPLDSSEGSADSK